MDKNLKRSVYDFREAIISIKQSRFSYECQLSISFPRGACMDASMLLGYYLYDKYNVNCDYVVGVTSVLGMMSREHAWLEYAGYKIDITASQFDDIINDVLIVTSHPLYEDYKEKSRVKVFAIFPERLYSAYDIIKEELNENF